jgi:hypothetical protein
MKKIICFFIGIFLSLQALGQVVQVKGVGTISYSGELTPSERDRAYKTAQVAAVERYFAENGEAESQNFEAIQPTIESNLDKFILGTIVLNEQEQVNLRKYTIAVRVELNVAKLRNTLRASSAVSKSASGEKSQLVYVFVGREVSSVRSFDERVVKRVEVTGSQDASVKKSTRGTEGESIGATSISTNASKQTSEKASLNASAKMETGGSSTRKADDTTYRLLPMMSTKTSITSVFSQGGYVVSDPEFVLTDKDLRAVNHDYSSGNDLAPSTVRAVVMSMKKSQVPYLVLATLDVGAPAMDAATGLQRVAVSVTGRVLDLTSNLPREVASVPTVQYFGVGPDNSTASTKALKEASVATAREVVSRLNAAGIR